ncbi:MAG: OB-fold nucleic acid binding domain-containing protein, partial [Nitrospiria bacterium]
MSEEHSQVTQRVNKVEALRARGIEPYGARFDGKTALEQITTQYGPLPKPDLETNQVHKKIAGRVVSIRRFGKAAFAHLRDASGQLQVYFKKNLLGENGTAIFEKLDIGDTLGVDGRLFRTKTDELTLEAHKLTFLSKSLHPLPEKWHGLTDVALRYRMRYLDLIANPEVKKVFEVRSKIINTIRLFLTERGF